MYTKITRLYSYIKQIQIFKWITEFLAFSLKRNNVYINISNKHNSKSIHSPKNCGSNWNEVVLFQKQIQRLSIEEPIYILSCYFNSTYNNWWLLKTLANSNEMDNQHPSLYNKCQLSSSIEAASHQSLHVTNKCELFKQSMCWLKWHDNIRDNFKKMLIKTKLILICVFLHQGVPSSKNSSIQGFVEGEELCLLYDLVGWL